MKRNIIIIAIAISVGFLAACSGDHGAQSGKDTQANDYKVAKDTSKVDTSKATGEDNSGSGGTKISDTAKKPSKP